MGWNEKCLRVLDEKGLFENFSHRTRFKELLDCYGSYPFFTKGLCKCMYLSAWDEEHFVIMLEILTDMALGREHSTRDMEERGDTLLAEQTDAEYYVYLLSSAFLGNKPYCPEYKEELPEEIAYIIRRAQEAAGIIDSVE